MSYITAIGTANPPHRFSQTAIAGFMSRAMHLANGDGRRIKAVFRSSGIEFRHSVLEDYGRKDGFTFFPDTPDLEPFPGTQKRLDVFRANALPVSLAAIADLRRSYAGFDPQEITHLIVVCCTGMYAPGLDIDLVHALQLRPSTQRTAINFMGCHAAFNAMRIADLCCRSDRTAKVLVVCTELCSLHFQRSATADNILANALFADGSACMLVEGETKSPLRLRFEHFHSALAIEGASDMAWTIGDKGFQMRLSSYVPELIKHGIGALTDEMLQRISLTVDDIRYFAIHPGGKRILEAVEEELGISPQANAAAYAVLRDYGNMSSATVVFVMKNVVAQLSGNCSGDRMLSIAFGPGLTVESMLLRIENCD